MFDEKVRLLVGLNKDDYIKLMENYSKFIKKNPEKLKAEKDLKCIKSANMVKVITIKRCKHYIRLVRNRLDVKKDDLCEDCKKFLANQILI